MADRVTCPACRQRVELHPDGRLDGHWHPLPPIYLSGPGSGWRRTPVRRKGLCWMGGRLLAAVLADPAEARRPAS